MENLKIRAITLDDHGWIVKFLEEKWGSPRIVSRGKIHQADELPGFIAEQEQNLIGLVTL